MAGLMICVFIAHQQLRSNPHKVHPTYKESTMFRFDYFRLLRAIIFSIIFNTLGII